MYSIKFLKPAINDITKIINYIYYDLNNSQVALKLLQEFVKSRKMIMIFPKSNRFNKKYCKHKVKNYYMFYTIDKKLKLLML